MGFISNQWLNRGYGLLHRGYRPVKVTIEVVTPTDSWSKRRMIPLEITATQKGGEYQTLHLTAQEAIRAAEVILELGGHNMRSELALELLKTMPDAQLLEALTSELRRRLREAPKRVSR